MITPNDVFHSKEMRWVSNDEISMVKNLFEYGFMLLNHPWISSNSENIRLLKDLTQKYWK